MSAVEKDVFGTTVEGRTTRALLPQSINEIGRNDVTLLPGAEVLGGIYCRDLEVRGAGCVHGPVLAAGSVSLTVPTGEFSIVGPLVGQRSLMARAAIGARVRIVGDVSAPRLNLEGAVVYGNVVGSNVTLRNCLVLGLVEASEDLRLADTACLTFVARRVETGPNVRLLFCAAGAQEELRLGEALQVETFAAPTKGVTVAPADARYVALKPGEVEHCVTHNGDGSARPWKLVHCFDRVVNLESYRMMLEQKLATLEEVLSPLAQGDFSPTACAQLEAGLLGPLRDE